MATANSAMPLGTLLMLMSVTLLPTLTMHVWCVHRVRCVNCRARLYRLAMKQGTPSMWRRWILNLRVCPECSRGPW